MKATKFSEIRDSSNEQLDVLLKDAKDKLFRLRLQARMERLDSPSELKKNKKTIAQILTIRSMKKNELKKQELAKVQAEKKVALAQAAAKAKAEKAAQKAKQEKAKAAAKSAPKAASAKKTTTPQSKKK